MDMETARSGFERGGCGLEGGEVTWACEAGGMGMADGDPDTIVGE